jgi:hypothetical protein
MTQPLPPIDLDAVRRRYDTFEAGWIGYPGEMGETEAEYFERVESQLHVDAVASAQDVPALVAEVERLQDTLRAGWEAARAALQREAERFQGLNNLTMWAALEVGAGTLGRLDFRGELAAAEEPEETIDVREFGGIEEWVLTCSLCGEVGRYPLVPFKGNSEAEAAWAPHLADAHSEEVS